MIGSLYREYTTEFGQPVKERTRFYADHSFDYWHHALGGSIQHGDTPLAWEIVGQVPDPTSTF